MSNMYLFKQIFTYNFITGVLDVIALACILCGILIIVSKNPIVSVLFLIGLFVSIATYLNVIGINFIGLSYLLVYVGAVSILFLFILMLINVRISELLSNTSNSIPLAIIVGTLFYYSISQILPYSINEINSLFSIESNVKEVFYTTTAIWDANLSEFSHITSIGNILYSNYSIWLILTSFLLLLAMVGAIVITIKQR